MAGLTSDSGANVRPVLKKDEIGHRSGFVPLDGQLSVPVAFELLNFWLGCRRDFVATHATLDGWNARYRSSTSIDVAVLARDFVITCMDFMTERNRLKWSRRLVRKS